MEESLTETFRNQAFDSCLKAVNLKDRQMTTKDRTKISNCQSRYVDTYSVVLKTLTEDWGKTNER